MIFPEIYSYGKYTLFFRETMHIVTCRVKHVLETSKFHSVGANLRNFYPFVVKMYILHYMNQLRHLHRMAKEGFYSSVKFANFNPILLSSFGVKLKNSKFNYLNEVFTTIHVFINFLKMSPTMPKATFCKKVI